MNTIKLGAIVLLSMLLTHPVLAGELDEFGRMYTDCGLGGMIAPRHEPIAVITNVTWDLGTTASSSYVSSPASCFGGRARMAAFIHDSQDILINELASGDGEYLNALIALAGVAEERKIDFISNLRSDVNEAMIASNFVAQSDYKKAEVLFNCVTNALDSNI